MLINSSNDIIDIIVHQMELVHSLGCCCTATQKPCSSFGSVQFGSVNLILPELTVEYDISEYNTGS